MAVALMALAALAIIIVAGCGSSSSSSSSSPTPSASATTATGSWTTADLAALQTDAALKAMLPSSIVSANNLRVASDVPYPPWEYYDPATSKNPAGFDFDLSQAIGKKIGIPTLFNETPFDSIILSIKGGKNDMIMSDMYDNLEREQQGVSFVDYAYDGTSVLVKKGNPNGITNLDSLAGKTVACESGTTQQAFLQKQNTAFKSAGKSAMTILALPNQPAALLAVTSGRAVGDLTDHSTAAYIAQTTNSGNTFEVVADPAAPEGYDPQLVGIGIVAKNTQLINTVQKALQDLIDEGAYQKIVAKYNLIPVKAADINQGSKPVPSTSPSP
ncbi:MAG TPA: ABC transporter substrate-binding protein [Thermoleophilia bacterium]|nr:ABC transporter substrate-binding protein [Thermoleophilia bacterium]